MNHVYAKIKHRGKSNKYRKVLSTNENIYHPADELIESSCPYTPGTMLETGAWFKISEFSKQKYSIEITHDDYETVDYDSLHESEYLQVDYLFAEIGGNLFFQNISKSKLVKKKGILGIGEKYQYENEIEVLFINEYPDAIYIPTEDALYFQRLESVSGIFKGMEELYGNGFPRIKIYLSDAKRDGQAAINFFTPERFGSNQEGSSELEQLFGHKGIFDNPKPTRLIRSLVQMASNDDSIVLDFFSGTATTAHAVMQLNAEDGGHRKFIMVQLPEKTDEESEAYKAGYKNICEIGKERIRRAGRKIKEDAGLTAPADLDIGFRCLRLDESNMKPVYYTPDEVGQQDLFSLVDNVKEDRTPEDLLFQVMLDLGVLLSSPIEVKEIAGKKVFNVADGFLLACFDHDVTEETVKAIAQMKPYYAVFRDSSMANDSVATNFEQIFETYSPDTVRKVL